MTASIQRRFVVWFAWFLLTGRVFHGKTERDLRDVTRTQAAFGLTALGICLLAATWFLLVIPTDIRNYLLLGGALGLTLGVIPLVFQTVYAGLSVRLDRYL